MLGSTSKSYRGSGYRRTRWPTNAISKISRWARSSKAARSRSTPAEIKAFASQFDPQPFHLDEQAAATTFFGGLVASGWHTAALTMRLIVDSELKIAGGSIGAGAEELKWPRPVRPGDTLHAVSEVLDVRPSKSRPDQGIIKMRTQTFNQDDQPVMIFVANMIVPTTPGNDLEEQAADDRQLSAHRELWNHRQHAHRRTGGHGRVDRLALSASFRFTERLRRDPRRSQGRPVPNRAGARRSRRKQYYWPGTNILITRFLHADGVGEVEDYMPVGEDAPGETIRRVRTVRGTLTFRLECRPAFDYARASHEIHVTEHGIRFDGPGISLGLASSVPLEHRRCGRDRRVHPHGGPTRHICAEAPSAPLTTMGRPRVSRRRRRCFATRSATGGAGCRMYLHGPLA